MKQIKNTTKNIVNSISTGVADLSSSIASVFGHKWRLKGRIKLCNRWAKKNPKKFMVYFFSLMMLILAFDLISLAFFHEDRLKAPITGLVQANSYFEKRRNIDQNRERAKEKYEELIQKGNILLNQLDSLKNIPQKTHKDSIELAITVRQLNILSNSLSYEKN